MVVIKIKTFKPEETYRLGEKLAALLQAGDVVCLSGTLGAGKTLLTQGIAAGLKIREAVTSPTFTIMNVYDAPIRLYHFDLYRLEQPGELADIGFDEYTGPHSDGVAIIEWPDRFDGYMPEENFWLTISLGEQTGERVISLAANGGNYERRIERLKDIANSCD
ncbi:tRNA (adenosine(37)-N6)-threonylcarbamoyltransferase complex ATPase subunit type 1 TsaE [Propionispora hippei]|uniref:tRNA threonylcarbamoyladenosine biosynthesis protein TsaE n=1 Tax=Propionispora hippei DSM 15287 TaxID=1123003 RepID=A0A1M6C3K3_9FIRM|nr:tRNA (adenosine(37)-N6)-threonylcarbamoyltransferase complex ATPase subunit type 1 TsaE [Propionispora hippei]SHI55597.1 tRNA threonylcarbamoyladenosine biosynthesis protein TsaE [Propionispora hippei DSM 15287]